MNERQRADDGGNRIARQLNASAPPAPSRAAVLSASGGGAAGRGAATATGTVSWASLGDAAAAELERRAANLQTTAQAAAGSQGQARSADGSVTVTVDGRNRVTSVRITGEAIGSAPGELARVLSETVTSALEEGRRATQALLSRADSTLQAWIADAAAAGHAGAATPVTSATSADGSITATVSHAATTVAIELRQEVSRGNRQAWLGDDVAETVNAALAAAEQAGREQLGSTAPAAVPDPWSAGKAALDGLTSRMDLLLGELDRIGSRLGG